MEIPIIDGCARGKTYTGPDTRFYMINAKLADAPDDVMAEQVGYRVHKASMFGRLVFFASEHPLLGDVDPADMFEALVSDAAKKAAMQL